MVNHDGGDGTAPDPPVWSAGALTKRTLLPGPPAIWDSEWVNVPATAISADDIAHGPILLVFWLNGLLSWAPFIGLLVVWILGLVVSRMLNYLFFTSFGLVRGCLWRRLIQVIFPISVLAGPFGQALIFGALVVSLLP